MRFTLDTNVLVYAVDRSAGERHERALEITRRARGRDAVLTLQALAELFRNLSRPRFGLSPERATAIVDDWRMALPVVAADEICLGDAMSAVADHRLSFWDSMMWATARRHGCRLMLTEDGQSGRVLGGVTFIDPFVKESSRLLSQALG